MRVIMLDIKASSPEVVIPRTSFTAVKVVMSVLSAAVTIVIAIKTPLLSTVVPYNDYDVMCLIHPYSAASSSTGLVKHQTCLGSPEV